MHFEDVDFARTPFYGRYFTWVDRAWERVLNAHEIFFSDMVGRQKIGLPIVEAVCRYRRPLALDDVFAVELRVSELTRKRVTTEFRFRKLADGQLTAEGHVGRHFVDMDAFKGREVPDGLYERFRRLALALSDWPPA